MNLCRVDFFDRSLNNVHHDMVDLKDIGVDIDYLAPENSEVYIHQTNNVSATDFIYISGPFTFLGIVNGVSFDNSSKTTKVTVKAFTSMFDTDILFDTDLQSVDSQDPSTSLEHAIAGVIQKYWMNSGDDEANLSVLELNLFSSTTNWGFNLKPDTSEFILEYTSDGNVTEKKLKYVHYCIIGFYSVLITKAFTKYGITITPRIDFARKKIILDIGHVDSVLNLQADRDGVQINAFDIEQSNQTINKVYIHNTEDYRNPIIYYLHSDGSYNTTNDDRVTPVVFAVKTATPSNLVNFNTAAQQEAANVFDNIDWESLIELETSLTDPLINPLQYEIGTLTRIWHYGQSYNTILSGKKYSSMKATLYYGTVRTTLTKKKILANAKF